MQLVMLTALIVGGSTVLGSVIGFFFRDVSHRLNDAILSFAAGVMLAASALGLIVPAWEMVAWPAKVVPLLGVFVGALFLNLMDRLTPHLHHLTGMDEEAHHNNPALNKVLLFVLAIAIHNLPEGLAAGVGFGSGDVDGALTVAAGIALQNVPEGMIVVSPMVAAGVSRGRALMLAVATALIEVVGTFLGYFLSTLSGAVLPFLLAFAGGTMLYVISDEMIPETHSHGYERLSTYCLLAGFCAMLVMDSMI